MAESTFDPDLFASLIEDVSRLKVGAGIDQVEVKPVETATRIKANFWKNSINIDSLG